MEKTVRPWVRMLAVALAAAAVVAGLFAFGNHLRYGKYAELYLTVDTVEHKTGGYAVITGTAKQFNGEEEFPVTLECRATAPNSSNEAAEIIGRLKGSAGEKLLVHTLGAGFPPLGRYPKIIGVSDGFAFIESLGEVSGR